MAFVPGGPGERILFWDKKQRVITAPNLGRREVHYGPASLRYSPRVSGRIHWHLRGAVLPRTREVLRRHEKRVAQLFSLQGDGCLLSFGHEAGIRFSSDQRVWVELSSDRIAGNPKECRGFARTQCRCDCSARKPARASHSAGRGSY